MKNSLTTLVDDDKFARFIVLQKVVRDEKKEFLSNSALLRHLMMIGIEVYENEILCRDAKLKKNYILQVEQLKKNFLLFSNN
jgi:hypothetical protein